MKPSQVTACNNSESREGFLIAFFANPAAQSNFTFRQTTAGFLGATGLPFVDILSEKLIARVFAKHGGLFGRTSTTTIVFWAFLSQVSCVMAKRRPAKVLSLVSAAIWA
ncbi:MAG TPA: hypothetical protein DDZ51_15455 [Planctomycetaceae bacterium]|nr:hypothetical protein [Planctomycetaceae bacterium]